MALDSSAYRERLTAILLNHRSFLDRLGELRTRLLWAAAALAVCIVAAWFLYSPILALLVQPLRSVPGSGAVVSRGKLIFTAPTEAFLVRVRLAAYAGTAFASPFILWQLWRFLTAGLRRNSARSALVLVGASVVLFAVGTIGAFAFVGPALRLFLYLGGGHVTLIPRASEYLSFLMLLIVSFGLTFEYPLLLLGLIWAGIISSDTLRKRRRLAWFVLIVISAVVTPTVDPITPLALAVPLALLYEATIGVARLMKR
jgi:sec-independent protein translocase protein TatC